MSYINALKVFAGHIITVSEMDKFSKGQFLNFIEEAGEYQVKAFLLDGEIIREPGDQVCENIVDDRFEISGILEGVANYYRELEGLINGQEDNVDEQYQYGHKQEPFPSGGSPAEKKMWMRKNVTKPFQRTLTRQQVGAHKQARRRTKQDIIKDLRKNNVPVGKFFKQTGAKPRAGRPYWEK